MHRWIASLAVLTACGRIAFDERSDAAVVMTDIAIAIDAPGAFGAPVALGVLNSVAEESDPTVTGDGLEIFYTTQRNGTRDIFRATRATTADAWGIPAIVSELSTSSEDDTARITPDGLVIYFGSDRIGGSGSYDIYMSTRATRTTPWAAPTRVTELCTTLLDLSANLSSTRTEVMWHSDRPGGAGLRDIFRATRAGTTGAFTNIEAVTSLISTASDRSPHLTNGDLVAWFDSDRTGGAGLRDLYTSERATPTDPFVTPTAIVELNSPQDDLDPYVSPDGSWIVFSSNRGGNGDLYEAFR